LLLFVKKMRKGILLYFYTSMAEWLGTGLIIRFTLVQSQLDVTFVYVEILLNFLFFIIYYMKTLFL
jgi:hypothetical protein